MTHFLLIRHGATDAIGHVLSGRTPGVHLNADGRKQAQGLGKMLKDRYPLKGILASPLERAVETAQPIADAQGLTLSVDESFIEFDFGAWTGLHFSELDSRPEWREYNRYRSLYSAPEGESLADVQRRAWKRIQTLCPSFGGEMLAIVSHADVIRAVLLFALGMPLDNVLRLAIPLASVTELQIGEGSPVVRSIGIVERETSW
jgi:broad specificity phosphatase PhoE